MECSANLFEVFVWLYCNDRFLSPKDLKVNVFWHGDSYNSREASVIQQHLCMDTCPNLFNVIYVTLSTKESEYSCRNIKGIREARTVMCDGDDDTWW